MLLAAGSLEGFSVNRQLRAVLRWTAVPPEGDAWLAIAERNTREPVQAAVKARLGPGLCVTKTLSAHVWLRIASILESFVELRQHVGVA